MTLINKVVSISLACLNSFSQFLLLQSMILNHFYCRFKGYLSQFPMSIYMDMNGLMFIQIEEEP